MYVRGGPFFYEHIEVGGPMVVGFLTPQRNAMTLAAKDFFFGINDLEVPAVE